MVAVATREEERKDLGQSRKVFSRTRKRLAMLIASPSIKELYKYTDGDI